jgi:hypothetical protein
MLFYQQFVSWWLGADSGRETLGKIFCGLSGYGMAKHYIGSFLSFSSVLPDGNFSRNIHLFGPIPQNL